MIVPKRMAAGEITSFRNPQCIPQIIKTLKIDAVIVNTVIELSNYCLNN